MLLGPPLPAGRRPAPDRPGRPRGRPRPRGRGRPWALARRCQGVTGWPGGEGCRCRKPVPPGRMPAASDAGWPVLALLGWDDLRLVGLKLIFLIASRVVSLLGLSRRESWWKDAEILMLRHQLAVALRERPRAPARLTWPDRAWLAILAETLPAGRLARL